MCVDGLGYVYVSNAVYVDLKYDTVFVLWFIIVCEWLGGDLSEMGCCVVCACVVVTIFVGV